MASINFNVGFRQEERVERNYKLKGLTIPIQINSNNYNLKENLDLNAIEEAIYNIFHWYRGERILNPEFGNPLVEYVYEPVNTTTAKKISVALSSAITTWEPRIKIQNLLVEADEDNHQYYIKLLYDVPLLNLYNVDYNKLVTIGD